MHSGCWEPGARERSWRARAGLRELPRSAAIDEDEARLRHRVMQLIGGSDVGDRQACLADIHGHNIHARDVGYARERALQAGELRERSGVHVRDQLAFLAEIDGRMDFHISSIARTAASAAAG